MSQVPNDFAQLHIRGAARGYAYHSGIGSGRYAYGYGHRGYRHGYRHGGYRYGYQGDYWPFWGWGAFASDWPYYDDYGYAYGAPVYDSDVAYCVQRFRSYDLGSRTYLGNDGYRHLCP